MKLCVIFLSGVLATSCHVFPNTKKVSVRWRGNGISEEAEKLSGIELVEYVNKAQSLFKANFSSKFAQYPSSIKRKLMGVKKIEVPVEYRISEKTNPDINEATIPASFDARQQWPYCPSIKFIRDQSSCGSCWAFGAAEAMTDRYCIASQGKEQITISADDIMSCCGFTCGDGCNGGYPIQAWHYWVKHGIVSGGNYTSKDGCKPYPYPPCEHHNNSTHYEPCPGDIYPTNKCQKLCQSGYPISYNNDKHYGKSAYAVSRKVAEIQKEIMTHGPVEVSYNVYEDFEHYSGGIYVHTAGEMLGGHAVKMIGWGVENGTPYWICSNSWNSDWGENGFFRIIRGLNECGIESGVVAGEPKL